MAAKQDPQKELKSLLKGKAKPRVKPVPKPYWLKVVEIGEQIPKDAWDTCPTDGARNVRHYLYGHPKQK